MTAAAMTTLQRLPLEIASTSKASLLDRCLAKEMAREHARELLTDGLGRAVSSEAAERLVSNYAERFWRGWLPEAKQVECDIRRRNQSADAVMQR